MSQKFIETLEGRQLFSSGVDATVATAFRAPRSAAETHEGVQDPAAKTNLTAAEVTTILQQAAAWFHSLHLQNWVRPGGGRAGWQVR